MYAKTLISLIALVVVTGNAQAGVITATWFEQGFGSAEMRAFEANPPIPTPSDKEEERQVSLLCSNCCEGLAGVAASGGGISFGSVAWSGIAYLLQTKPELRWRIHFDDDFLPDSPVLSGLLKPS